MCYARGLEGRLLPSLLRTTASADTLVSDPSTAPSSPLRALPSLAPFSAPRRAARRSALSCPHDESSRLGRAGGDGDGGGEEGRERGWVIPGGRGERVGESQETNEERNREEATGSRESSCGTDGYMAVCIMYLDPRVTYSFVVVHIKSERRRKKERGRDREQVCVYTSAHLSVCECVRARDARCTSAKGISSLSRSLSFSLPFFSYAYRVCVKAHFARTRAKL